MTGEVFSWLEGQAYFHTGSATASAVVGFAQSLQGQFVWGYENYPTLGGYGNVLTGLRADVTIAAFWTPVSTIARLAQSATAVHMHIRQSNGVASAGYKLWSGRIGSILLAGNEGGVLQYSIGYYANEWSAYGT